MGLPVVMPGLALKMVLAGLVVRMVSMRARKSPVAVGRVAWGWPPGENWAVAVEVAMVAHASILFREARCRLAVAR